MSGKEVLSVVIVNETKKKVFITPDMTVKNLFDMICSKAGIKNSAYFCLAEVREDSSYERYLDFTKTLQEEGINGKSEVFLKIRYMKVPSDFDDVVTTELFFLQVKEHIVREKYPCPEKIAILLASHQLQILFGDFSPKKHRVGYLNKVGLNNYLPKTVARHDYAYWHERIFPLYAKLKGMDKKTALQKYLEIATTIPCFGMSFYDIKEHLIGVAQDGLFLFSASNFSLIESISFNVLHSWSENFDNVEITYTNSTKEIISKHFTIPTEEQRKDLLELLDAYFYLYPEELKNFNTLPRNPQPKILPNTSMYIGPPKRLFYGRFRSRLDYLKGYYMESCALVNREPIREFCLQIDMAIDNNRTLTEVDLSRSENVDDISFELVSKALVNALEFRAEPGLPWQENMDIEVLNISNNKMHGIGVNDLNRLLSFLSNLRILNMTMSYVENKGALNLAPFIGKLQDIEELNFSGCNIGNKGAIALIEAASTANKKGFKSFIARISRISERLITQYLAQYLESNTSLKKLDLCNSNIDAKGFDLLFKALESNDTLEYLDLSFHDDLVKATPRLASMLEKNRSLQFLNLDGCKLGSDFLGKFAKALKTAGSNSKLTKLHLAKNQFGQNLKADDLNHFCQYIEGSSLIEIDLSGNLIDSANGYLIIDALSSVSSLQTVLVANNVLGQVAALEEMIKKCQQLSLLDLSSNGLTSPVIEMVLKALADCSSIKELRLDGNNQARDGLCSGLDAFLNGTNHCTILTLNNTHLTDDMLSERIGKNIKSTSHLQYLSIRQNYVTLKGVEGFVEILKTNKATCLKTFDLQNNKNLFLFNEVEDRNHLLQKILDETCVQIVHL